MKLEAFKAVVPLLVVVLTAAVSGYLVPKITQSWQNHQKELEIKTSLVESINDTVLQIILAMQFAERNASTQEAFDEAYRKWEIERAVVSGKLRAYFGGSNIADDFERFSEAVSDFYALGGTSDPQYRAERINKLRSYFGDEATDWKTLADLEMRHANFLNWFRAWWDLRAQVLRRKDAFVRDLLAVPVDFLRFKWF